MKLGKMVELVERGRAGQVHMTVTVAVEALDPTDIYRRLRRSALTLHTHASSDKPCQDI